MEVRRKVGKEFFVNLAWDLLKFADVVERTEVFGEIANGLALEVEEELADLLRGFMLTSRAA